MGTNAADRGAATGAITEHGSNASSAVKSAAEAAGLLAGIVAAVYLLGGLVLAVRLLSDGFPPDAVVTLLGQAPREFVISAGLVEAALPAALVGLFAAMLYGARDLRRLGRPKHEAGGDPMPKREARPEQRVLVDGHEPIPKTTLVWLVPASALLALPVFLVALIPSGNVSTYEWPACIAALLSAYPAALAWWILKRRLARQDKTKWGPYKRSLAYGALWTAMVLPTTVLTVGVIDFPRVRFCVDGTSAPFAATGDNELRLVTQTRDRTIVAVREQGRKSVLSLPTNRVTRLQAGSLPGSPLKCAGPLFSGT